MRRASMFRGPTHFSSSAHSPFTPPATSGGTPMNFCAQDQHRPRDVPPKAISASAGPMARRLLPHVAGRLLTAPHAVAHAECLLLSRSAEARAACESNLGVCGMANQLDRHDSQG